MLNRRACWIGTVISAEKKSETVRYVVNLCRHSSKLVKSFAYGLNVGGARALKVAIFAYINYAQKEREIFTERSDK